MSVICKVLILVRKWTLVSKNQEKPENDCPDLSEVSSLLQQTLVAAEPNTSSIELYRRQEMLELHSAEWGMALQIFNVMGWTPERPLEVYAAPLFFV